MLSLQSNKPRAIEAIHRHLLQLDRPELTLTGSKQQVSDTLRTLCDRAARSASRKLKSEIPSFRERDLIFVAMVEAKVDHKRPDFKLDPKYLEISAAHGGCHLLDSDAHFAECVSEKGELCYDLIQYGDRRTWDYLVYAVGRVGWIEFMSHWDQCIRTIHALDNSRNPDRLRFWKHFVRGLLLGMPRSLDQKARLIEAFCHLDDAEAIWIVIKHCRDLLSYWELLDRIPRSAYRQPGVELTGRQLEYVCSLQDDHAWDAALRVNCTKMPRYAPIWVVQAQANKLDDPATFLIEQMCEDLDRAKQLLSMMRPEWNVLFADRCVVLKAYHLLLLAIQHSSLAPETAARCLLERKLTPPSLVGRSLDQKILPIIQKIQPDLTANRCALLRDAFDLCRGEEILEQYSMGSSVQYVCASCDHPAYVTSTRQLDFGERYPRVLISSERLAMERRIRPLTAPSDERCARHILEVSIGIWFVYLWGDDIHQEQCLIEASELTSAFPYFRHREHIVKIAVRLSETETS